TGGSVSSGISLSSATSVRRCPCSRVSFSITRQYSKRVKRKRAAIAMPISTKMPTSRAKTNDAENGGLRCQNGTPSDDRILSRGPSRHGRTPKNRTQHVADVVGRADVASASGESGHPHLLIGNAVRAHNGHVRKFVMQAFNIGQRPVLEIENDGLGTIQSNIVPQL